MLGWKEFEMEVVRDKADNAIIICSIENVDAMGVHTGNSITVAPALTLTDKEYQRMRSASIAVLREIGVETGGSNVQFAVNPEDGRMVVIEMNPRVSRSSALASKATGFPIAKIAAKLAVGYTLDELKNDITKVHAGLVRADHRLCGDQDPALRLREIPRRRAAADHLDEIGRRSHGDRPHLRGILQKALRSLETGLTGLDEIDACPTTRTRSAPRLARPRRTGLRWRPGDAAMAFRSTRSSDHQIRSLVPGRDRSHPRRRSAESRTTACPKDATAFRRLKTMGFSDARLAKLTGQKEAEVRAARQRWACARCSSASTPAPRNSRR